MSVDILLYAVNLCAYGSARTQHQNGTITYCRTQILAHAGIIYLPVNIFKVFLLQQIIIIYQPLVRRHGTEYIVHILGIGPVIIQQICDIVDMSAIHSGKKIRRRITP